MSIFKSTFKPFVVRQINTRQSLISEISRPVEFANYVSSKSPWIKMTSFVDYEGSSNLAKKRVLMGGTLYHKVAQNENGDNFDRFSLRRGIGGAGAAYASELGTNQYGIRPMPGITGLTTKSLGAYGSLAQATIKFVVWDVKQLEELSILFMRPGYKVLLEWGWSMFLDTSVSGEDYKAKPSPNALKDKSNYKIVASPLNTIDCFNENITQDYIYDKLDSLRHQYSANYDGVLGSIMNFEYVLMPNGGFECSTTLISIGDVIDTIRINNVTTDNIGGSEQTAATNPDQNSSEAAQEPKEDIKTQFELLMDLYCNIDDNNPRDKNPIITGIDNAIPESSSKNIDKFIYKYTSTSTYNLTEGADAASQAMFESQFAGNMRESLSDNTVSPGTEITPPTVDQTVPISEYTPGDIRRRYYIQFAYFIHVLNVMKNVFAEKDQTLVTIEIPGTPTDDKISNGLCQASYNSISIDPNTAMIRNPNALLFTSKNEVKGFLPEIYRTEYLMTDTGGMKDYLYGNTNFGLIGNVYLNIGGIVDTYKKQSAANNGNVFLGELISELLNKMSFSLGSINDFDKFVLNNKVAIIDKHYTELPSDALYNNKFKINISGNNSIVRSHKIQSKIFPSQATMIAIAAQDRENVASLQSSTYSYLNNGLKDRLFRSSTDSKSQKDSSNDSVVYYKKLYDNILSLIYYVNNYVIPNQSINPQHYYSNVNSMNTYLNTLLVQIERGTDYKAVVPISVEMTIDGLSGFTIGQIFTVNKDVLPKDYESKSVGFIVTGISNDINTHSWTTTVTSQMCLLDQDKRQADSLRNSENILKIIEKQSEDKKTENSTACVYFNILAAITMDCLLNRYKIDVNSGAITVRNTSDPLYTKAAIQEFASGLVDFDYVLKELNTAYITAFPFPEINTETKKAFRRDNLNDPIVINKVIYEISLYKAMGSVSSEVLTTFNNEYASKVGGVIQARKTESPTSFETWKQAASDLFNFDSSYVTSVDALLFSQESTLRAEILAATTFSIIDISKAVDPSTGLFNGPITKFFISGYKYYNN